MGSWLHTYRRPAAELRYVEALLGVFAALPQERRDAVRGEIGRLACSPAEGRALFDVLVRGKTLTAACAATGVSMRRLSQLRREFYECLPL